MINSKIVLQTNKIQEQNETKINEMLIYHLNQNLNFLTKNLFNYKKVFDKFLMLLHKKILFIKMKGKKNFEVLALINFLFLKLKLHYK